LNPLRDIGPSRARTSDSAGTPLRLGAGQGIDHGIGIKADDADAIAG
jgi:hypothetical protein